MRFLYAMLAILIILVINQLKTCSWTRFKGHLNYIHNYKKILVHMTNLNPGMASLYCELLICRATVLNLKVFYFLYRK